MSLIGRFEYLPKRPRSEEAKPLLEKIASQVKPIMFKRGWKVGTLAEFLPANPALLGNNVNHGQRINLRLRPPGDTSTFYDFDQLVLVMLHELTHIVHGPHDASFYKLLAILEEEFYDLKRKGYEGEGFHSSGNRLHGVRINEYEGRRKGLAAAEKRLATRKAMGSGGVLGGSARHSGKTMREIVAEAAERRIKDDKTCNTATPAEVEVEVRRAQEESVGFEPTDTGDGDVSPPVSGSSTSTGGASSSAASTPMTQISSAGAGASTPRKRSPEVIDLTGDSPERTTRPLKQLATATATPASTSTSTSASAKPPALKAKAAPKPVPQPKEWTCSTCTLINPLSAKSCDACAAPRPALPPSKDGWFCDFCGSGPRAMDFWSCADCGSVRKWG